MNQFQIRAKIHKADIEILGECRGRCNMSTFKDYTAGTLEFLGFRGSLTSDGMYTGLLVFGIVACSQSDWIAFNELFDGMEY